MKRKTLRRKGAGRKLFRLQLLTPMRPYVARVMDDLRTLYIRRVHLQRLVDPAQRRPDDSYAVRRRRYEANIELRNVSRRENQVRRELRRAGAEVGDILRGEMQFPCLVGGDEAYFVWYDQQPQPTHWRYRRDDTLTKIPQAWWNADDDQPDPSPWV